MADNNEYNANSMVELDDKTHLRKRPVLTLGQETGDTHNPYSSMQRTCVREIYENSIDEALNGYADKLKVSFFKDHSFEVFDNGRGIPVDVNTTTGKSGIMQAIGTLQSGRNFDSKDTKKSTGTNGLGASAVAVFSKRYDVTVYRNKKKYELSFRMGVPGFFDEEGNPDSNFTELNDLSYLKESPDDRTPEEKKGWATGTKTRVWLDMEGFPTRYHYDEQDIIERLRGSAFLIPHITIDVYNELKELEDPNTQQMVPQREIFHFEDGLPQMVEHIMPDEPITSTISFETVGTYVDKNVPVLQKDGSVKSEDLTREVPIHVAFGYGNGYEFTSKTFVNSVNTHLHGVHLVAFEKAMSKVFNERFSTMRGMLTKNDELPTVDDFHEGLTVVISVFANEPQFTSQSKEQFSGKEVQKAILDSLEKEFENWIKSPANSADLQVIAQKVTTASKNRQRIREQRDLNRKKNEVSSSSMPLKLKECELAGTEEAELYICEGESAVGSLKAARNGKINALLPIKGKIINSHRKDAKTVLENQEVQDIMKTIGAGFGKDFDIEKMRYGKIFIACDADPDGGAIACLLYALFWNFFRPVILEGRLFKIETPLFIVATKQGSKSRKIYCREERERDQTAAELDKQNIKYVITRLKGLGEVDPEDLNATAISPETRVVTQVTVEEIEASQAALDLILGDDADLRKDWVEEFAPSIDEEILVGE